MKHLVTWVFQGIMSIFGAGNGTPLQYSCLQCGRPGFDPWVGKIPWRRSWQPTPVLLPGESHGQRSLGGYSPWGHKELDTTEQLSTARRIKLNVQVRHNKRLRTEIIKWNNYNNILKKEVCECGLAVSLCCKISCTNIMPLPFLRSTFRALWPWFWQSEMWQPD